jgi:hypothetical protein
VLGIFKIGSPSGRWWLTPVILAAQEDCSLKIALAKLRRQRSGGLQFEDSPGKQFVRPCLEKKSFSKIGLVE